MKKYSFYINACMLCLGLSVLFASCKKNEIVDAAYPDQAIYLSQAAVAAVGPDAKGIYYITPNIVDQAQRSKMDVTGSKVNISLGVIRSGITSAGSYTLGIAANTDTITRLISAGKFAVAADPAATTEILPSNAFTLPASLELADGSTNAEFTLGLDLKFLINSVTATPKKSYALAVGISGAGKTAVVKPALATTVILIDPVQIILPVSNFTSYVYRESKTANFINVSANGATYSWNFGDGTPASAATSPTHVYTASGTYPVTLTTTGIAGSGIPSVRVINLVIP